MLIREARSEDGPATADMVFAVLRAYGVEPDPHGLDSDVVAFGQPREGVSEWVADFGGAIGGMVTLRKQTDAVGWISKLFVGLEHRRRGAGRELLRTAVDAAREQGHARVGLQTRDVFREAIRLYESEGWERGPDPPEGYGPNRTYWKQL